MGVALTLLFWLAVWGAVGGALLTLGWRLASLLKSKHVRRTVRSLLTSLIFGFAGFGVDGVALPVPVLSLLVSPKYWPQGIITLCFWWLILFFAMEISGKGGE